MQSSWQMKQQLHKRRQQRRQQRRRWRQRQQQRQQQPDASGCGTSSIGMPLPESPCQRLGRPRARPAHTWLIWRGTPTTACPAWRWSTKGLP